MIDEWLRKAAFSNATDFKSILHFQTVANGCQANVPLHFLHILQATARDRLPNPRLSA